MSTENTKEPWDFDTFVVAYNEITTREGGYQFSREKTPDELGAIYRLSIEKTIYEFAQKMFLYFQRT